MRGSVGHSCMQYAAAGGEYIMEVEKKKTELGGLACVHTFYGLNPVQEKFNAITYALPRYYIILQCVRSLLRDVSKKVLR